MITVEKNGKQKNANLINQKRIICGMKEWEFAVYL